MARKTPTLHEDTTLLNLWKGMNLERIAERIVTYELDRFTNREDASISHACCMQCKTVFKIKDAPSLGRLFCTRECSQAFYEESAKRRALATRRAERAIVRALCGLDPDKDDLRRADPLWDLPRQQAKIA